MRDNDGDKSVSMSVLIMEMKKMTRAVLVAAVLVLPSMALAQSGPASRDGSRSPIQDAVAAALGSHVAIATVVEAPPAAQQAPAARGGREPRRRPSMVGYISDSSIGSQVRIRFDAGYEASVPDRAEFFYAKCGCYRDIADLIPAAFDPSSPGPGPGVVTDLDFQQLYVLAEYAPHERVSVFGEVPIRWLKPRAFVPGLGSFDNQSGLSDIRFGVKIGAVSLPERQVTLQLQLAAPTGEPLNGLGTDHWSVEPTLLYFEQVTDRFAIEAQFGDVIPTDGSAGVPPGGSEKFSGSVLYYGIGPSYEVYSGDQVRIAPVVELVGWRVNGGFETVLDPLFPSSDGTNIVNLKFGVRLTMRDRSSIYIGYGHALTDAVWYDDIVRAEYRVGF